MYMVYRRVFLILLAGILALAAVSFGVSTYRIQREEQRTIENIHKEAESAGVGTKKHHWRHEPFSLDLCPQDGSKMAKLVGCLNVKRHNENDDNKNEKGEK